MLYRDTINNYDTVKLGLKFEKDAIAKPTGQKLGQSPPNNLPPITSGGIEVIYPLYKLISEGRKERKKKGGKKGEGRKKKGEGEIKIGHMTKQTSDDSDSTSIQ